MVGKRILCQGVIISAHTRRIYIYKSTDLLLASTCQVPPHCPLCCLAPLNQWTRYVGEWMLDWQRSQWTCCAPRAEMTPYLTNQKSSRCCEVKIDPLLPFFFNFKFGGFIKIWGASCIIRPARPLFFFPSLSSLFSLSFVCSSFFPDDVVCCLPQNDFKSCSIRRTSN